METSPSLDDDIPLIGTANGERRKDYDFREFDEIKAESLKLF